MDIAFEPRDNATRLRHHLRISDSQLVRTTIQVRHVDPGKPQPMAEIEKTTRLHSTGFERCGPEACQFVRGHASSLPAFDLFGRHYRVCDHWFASSLLLGTQASRLMAMAGESELLDNAGVLLPQGLQNTRKGGRPKLKLMTKDEPACAFPSTGHSRPPPEVPFRC